MDHMFLRGLSFLFVIAISPSSLAEVTNFHSENIVTGSQRPLVVVLTADIRSSIQSTGFQYFRKREVSLLTVSVPCHGEDVRYDEVEGLSCWAYRIAKGEDLFNQFSKFLIEKLNQLASSNSININKICFVGFSRGAFTAMKFMERFSLPTCLIGLAPVTDLGELWEFDKIKGSQLLRNSELQLHQQSLLKNFYFLGIPQSDPRVSTQKASEVFKLITRAGNFHSYFLTYPGNDHGVDDRAEKFLLELGFSYLTEKEFVRPARKLIRLSRDD